ncbi:expressed unknown protein [Ectocarpus siliculosus]|uniref:Uncharacterized protein n=1 Tax=Ectocarpus siliculosus TaxID=2880 RepID=D7G601_ECTSI|nr:expressed unknown protein [Ectocarpus siliculosus]|eukprot:CBJ33921.1 expressed unknown protein [Ectocarpus siliculosus]
MYDLLRKAIAFRARRQLTGSTPASVCRRLLVSFLRTRGNSLYNRIMAKTRAWFEGELRRMLGFDERTQVLASTRAKTAAATATPWVPLMYGVRDVFGDSDDDIDDNRPIHQVGDTDDDGDGEDGANGCSRDDSDDSVACVDPPTLSDKQRKGGRPTRKGQRSTSPRAGAAGCPVDLAREQRGEEGATRKKASKGASGDPLDVDSGVSEQPAPRGKKKASVKTRKAGGKKKAPANTKKTAGKKVSEPVSEFESESESDTTRTLRSARRKVTPEQRKNLTEMSKSTCPDRIKERDAAFAAHNESLRRGRGRLSWPRKALRRLRC